MAAKSHFGHYPTTASIDPNSGFCTQTHIYHSLQPSPPVLPSPTAPISVASYALSLLRLHPSPTDTVILADAVTGDGVTLADFIQRVETLSSSLRHSLRLLKGDAALVLSPNSTRLPILFFSLLSLGVVVSPANPAGTESEISRQVSLSKASIVFATSSAAAHKLFNGNPRIILIDSPEFDSLMTATVHPVPDRACPPHHLFRIESSPLQNDVAAVLYSSGTTGKMKGVELTHRNLTAVVASYLHSSTRRRGPAEQQAMVLFTVPLFHVYGFNHIIKAVAFGERAVLMERWGGARGVMTAVERFRVTRITVAPPVVVAMTKTEFAGGDYQIGSLKTVSCAGAPLGKDVIAAFSEKFPGVVLTQGYGLTETSGAAFRALTPKEPVKVGSTGRLVGSFEAKIVDVITGKALPPYEQGELWFAIGFATAVGYVGDIEATSEDVVSDGWLRTGDLCYIDGEGYLFVLDRLKELIKYKGYQVAAAELEQKLQSHPEIVDAAVIPFPDDEAGEIPMAFVVRNPKSSLNKTRVMEFVANQVAPYKKIRRVSFVASIPKTATGKILRKELRNLAVSSSRL